MHSAFRIWVGLLLLLAIILLSIFQTSDATESYAAHFSRFKRQTRTCDCKYATDRLLCASNGITYPSECRFNCAKARNFRLRIVSSGSCRGKSLSDYRRGQNGRN